MKKALTWDDRVGAFLLRGTGLPLPVSGDPAYMEQSRIHPPIPEDATESTAEQRAMQDQLDHRNEDPDAPARFQSRHQVADET
ncbi:hypothetical protein HZU40_00905 [Mycolicibacterium fluoranthenivorans]|uniref:Uncharacterized protein n=1 Tax=Mycolicibacterium fluoranthenivorans TaxID=258505 RepID=A0A7G8PF74_9MYCO|nr:hypothetical protein [Mycolicibacterium fluoranthenivorans]QNJ92990.1 hypothetical protein HZU40_00905 [Mycolicibacterium fluoranthenivorans]